jgi:DNA-binding response OmpR family regulator
MRRNIMIVDDDIDTCEMLRALLEHAGFVVQTANDGFSGLIELHDNEYDLLILDISLPHMSGFQVLKSLQADPALKNLPVIMLTAHADQDAVLKVQANVSDYVIKPLQPEDFLCRIERVLGGRPQFQEITFESDDPLAQGHFVVPLKLKSVSKRGALVASSHAMPKKCVLEAFHLGLLQKLEIDHRQFKVTDCHEIHPGEFSYFISFLGMSVKDQQKLQEWILEISFKAKSLAG